MSYDQAVCEVDAIGGGHGPDGRSPATTAERDAAEPADRGSGEGRDGPTGGDGRIVP
jgi:hypothetical protein